MNIAPYLESLSARLPPPRIIMDRKGERPYLTRWYLRGRPYMPPGPFHEPFDAHGNPFEEAIFPDEVSVYLHKIHRSDVELELHNHPWRWARALILAGGYFEERRDKHGTVRGWRRRPGDVVTIDADTYHRVVLSPCDACQATGALRRQVRIAEGFAPWVEPCLVCKGARVAPSWSLFVAGPRHGQSWRFWNRDTGQSWPWREFIFGHTGVTMDTSVFYRGLLCALRVTGRTKFFADGEAFHAAFRAMLEYAKAEEPSVPAQRMLENFDPVFGVSPEATEMVLEGERDFILSMHNPRLRLAEFKLSEETALKELNELPTPHVFRKLAKRLNAQLGQ